METLTDAIFLFAMVTFGLWKRYGWLMLMCGIGVIILSLKIGADNTWIYGMPFVGIGIGMVFIGAFRADKTGRG